MDSSTSGKQPVVDKKRDRMGKQSVEPPVLSRCEPLTEEKTDPGSSPSPPALRRETYVTRQKKATKQPVDERCVRQLRSFNAAQAATPAERAALILAGKYPKRPRLGRKRRERMKRWAMKYGDSSGSAKDSPAEESDGTHTGAPTEENDSTPGPSTRILRPRNRETDSSASSRTCTPIPIRTATPTPTAAPSTPLEDPAHIPALPTESAKSKFLSLRAIKEALAKEKIVPDKTDLVDGIEILEFASLEGLRKYTEAEESLRGPPPESDEEVDVEYYSDLEDDPATSALVAPTITNNVSSFSMSIHSDSSRTSTFDLSDVEADNTRQSETWDQKSAPSTSGDARGQDVDDEAPSSSAKNTMSGILVTNSTDRRVKKEEPAPEMPKVGMVVNVGLGSPLRPESARNIHQLLDQSGSLSRKMAEFSASVVAVKSRPDCSRTKIVVPVVCPKMLSIMKYKWAIGDRGHPTTLSTIKSSLDQKQGHQPSTSSGIRNVPPLNAPLLKIALSHSHGRRGKRKLDTVENAAPAKMIKSEKDTKPLMQQPQVSKPLIQPPQVSKPLIQLLKKSEPSEPPEITPEAQSEPPSTPPLESLEVLRELKPELSPPKLLPQPLKEVEDVMRDIIDYIALKDTVESIPYDPDQVEGALTKEDKLPSQIRIQQVNNKRIGKGTALMSELRRLDVTVFDMDDEATKNAPDVEEVKFDENCKKEMCLLGCVCESLAGRRTAIPPHCGRVDCMFACTCSSISYERRTEGRHLLDVSDAALAWIQDESERNLAKVERQFKQTVVRAKDDLIVMGSKRSRREIKLPERYREDFVTKGELQPHLQEMYKMQKKALSAAGGHPLIPTNKSLSPSKLITPPKLIPKPLTPPKPPKFAGRDTRPGKRPQLTPQFIDSSDDEDSSSPTRQCSVMLQRSDPDRPFTPKRRNVAMKSTSKARHHHNILRSSARTTSTFTEYHRNTKQSEERLTSMLKGHSEQPVFCHIVKEHSITAEEWERSGELATQRETVNAPSPLKKNHDAVQLMPWTYLRDKFHTGHYFIWYKCQGGTKHKLYLTDNPRKPNKSSVNLRELDASVYKDLPPMISKLVVKTEDPTGDDTDARCFLKSVGDFWMIAGYMQRTVGSSPPMSDALQQQPLQPSPSDEESIDVDDPASRTVQSSQSKKAQARWWLLNLARTFDILRFHAHGVTVKYSQIKRTALLANSDGSGKFYRMPLRPSCPSKFGIYGVPGMLHSVLIGPYGLSEKQAFSAYLKPSPGTDMLWRRVPLHCANKDSEWEVDGRGIGRPKPEVVGTNRVIGTWLYDFKSLPITRGVTEETHLSQAITEPSNDSVEEEQSAPWPISRTEKSQLNSQSESRAESEDSTCNTIAQSVSRAESEDSTCNTFAQSVSRAESEDSTCNTLAPKSDGPNRSSLTGRAKVRSGLSLLKEPGSDVVKSIDTNTLSVKIDGKAEQAVVKFNDFGVQDATLEISTTEDVHTVPQGGFKGRPDRKDNPAPRKRPKKVTETPPNETSGGEPEIAPDATALAQSSATSEGSASTASEHKREYLLSNIKNLGFIPVTAAENNSVVIPHFSVPGQIHIFKNYDEAVRHVYNAIKTKMLFVGFRPEKIVWRLVKSTSKAMTEKQFNPGVLLGNHVITNAGLINLAKIEPEEIPLLGLEKQHEIELATRLDHMRSLPLMRQLGRLLVGPKAGPMPQNAILFMASSEIEKLTIKCRLLRAERKELYATHLKKKARLNELVAGLADGIRQKTEMELKSTLHSESPVIVLDDDSNDGEGSRTEFFVKEMLRLSSNEDEGKGSASIEAAGLQRAVTVRSRASGEPPSGQHPRETVTNIVDKPAVISAIPTASVTVVSSTPTVSSPLPSTSGSQGLVCKFPFSPLKRVNVTVKEDGIVSTSSANSSSPPVQPYTRIETPEQFKGLKIVDSAVLKKIRPRILQTQQTKLNVAKTVTTVAGLPILRLPNGATTAHGEVFQRPVVARTMFMTKNGVTVPMAVVKNKTGESVVKIVSSPAQISSSQGVRPTEGGMVTAPRPGTVRPKLLVPPQPMSNAMGKASVIRVIKSVSAPATTENQTKSVLVPQNHIVEPTGTPSRSPTSGGEIDTTSLVID